MSSQTRKTTGQGHFAKGVRRGRLSGLGGLLLTTTAVIGFQGLSPAVAQTLAAQTARSFDIPAQPLAAALASFGRQSGLQVSSTAATSEGLTSRPVSGALSPDAALGRLLAGTGISYRITGDGTAIVGEPSPVADLPAGGAAPAADGSLVLDTIDVTGSGGTGVFATDSTNPGTNQIAITSEDLERSNPSDLQDVFAAQPGVSVGSSIPASQKVYVNGIEETALAVSIDGSRQNNKIFHHNATTVIDPALLKAVRVDPGVAPADAGPGALAGAIAYETKDAGDLLEPGRNVGGQIKSSFETNGETFTTGLTGYGRLNGFEFLGYINYATGNDFEAGNGENVIGSGADFLSGLGKVAYEAQSGDRLEFSYERVNDEAVRPFRANIGNLTNRFEPNRTYALDRKNAVLTYTDETPEGWWDPTIVLAYSVTDLDTGASPATSLSNAVTPSSGSTDSLNGKVENRFALGGLGGIVDGSITAGIDFYSDEAEYSDEFYTTSETADNVGFYAQARLDLTEDARLSFGGRGDVQSFEGTSGYKQDESGFSGNISGEYDLTDWLLAKAAYSHVWAGIPLAENFIMNPDWDYGDGIDPQTADNVSLGLRAQHEGFFLEGKLFRTDIADARDASFQARLGGPAIPLDILSQGFEIGTGYDWQSGFVSLKYADIDVEIDGRNADSDLGTYFTTPIGQIFTLQAAHTFTEWGLTIGGDARIALENDDTEEITGSTGQILPGYEVVDIFAEYVPPEYDHLSFRAEANNLFDEAYADRATYGQEFTNVTPLLEPGRTFKFTATARF